MDIQISERAVRWFKEEMALVTGDYVKFFPRYGGTSPVQEGFSLGMTVEAPDDEAGVAVEKDGIHFFVEERDLWYFSGYDLAVDWDQTTDGPEYHYRQR